jgi:hypothetical protein
MKTKVFISIISVMLAISVTAQRGQEANVLNKFKTQNDKELNLICKFINKVNAIKNENLTFVSIQFNDESKSSGNMGYVYLSNQAELDSFVVNLNSALSKVNDKEEFQIVNRKYKIEVVSKTTNVLPKKNRVTYYELRIYETISSDGTVYMSLNTKNVEGLINWLKTLIF